MIKNDELLTKILIVLVITILTLTAILYLIQYTVSEEFKSPDNEEYLHDFAEKILDQQQAVCGNGIVEGLEECDIGVLAEDVNLYCPSDEYVNYCNENCKLECLLKTDISSDLEGEIISEGELGYDIECMYIYEPVCGLFNGEYKTFENECWAELEGVTEYTDGECK